MDDVFSRIDNSLRGTMGPRLEDYSDWNARAHMGAVAGTRDLIAVELERRAISQYVRDGMKVLDVGCGNGETLFSLGRTFPALRMVGIDSAEGMIAAAERRRFLADGPDRFIFTCTDLRDYSPYPFDLIYTQRCIINLPDWPSQSAAIERIIGWLKPGGKYLMVECSQEGLDELNILREAVGLPRITPPMQNRYLRQAEVDALIQKLTNSLEPVIVEPFDAEAICSTYALLSRIVNAKMAMEAGVEPNYNSMVNRLALDLPNVGTYGQNRMWVWEKM